MRAEAQQYYPQTLVQKEITEEPGYTRRGNIVSIDTSLQIVDSLLNEELEELQKRINKN